MTVQTWYCPQCGSTDITHDALVAFDPVAREYTVVGLLDAKQCEECGCESPEFGVPGADEEDEA